MFAVIGDWPNFRFEDMFWCFVAGAALTAPPLAVRNFLGFRIVCYLEAVMLFVIGAIFFFLGAFLLWAGLVPLLVAATASWWAAKVPALALSAILPILGAAWLLSTL
ncbi:hypothetical protein ACQP2X_42715 [Actinoplanes sp. CA-131856]